MSQIKKKYKQLESLVTNYRRLRANRRNIDRIIKNAYKFFYTITDLTVFPLSFFLKLLVSLDARWKALEIQEFEGPFTEPVIEIAQVRARLSDVAEIVDLADQTFAELGVTREHRTRMYSHWMTLDPNAILFIEKKSEVHGSRERVGYTSVLSLTEEAYKMYRRGELSEYKLNSHHLAPYKSTNPARYILVQALAVTAKVDRELWKAIYHTLACHVAIHNPHPKIFPPILIADTPLESGARLARKFGFAEIGYSQDNTSLYEIDFSVYDKLQLSGKYTIDVIDILSAIYEPQLKCLPSESCFSIRNWDDLLVRDRRFFRMISAKKHRR